MNSGQKCGGRGLNVELGRGWPLGGVVAVYTHFCTASSRSIGCAMDATGEMGRMDTMDWGGDGC